LTPLREAVGPADGLFAWYNISTMKTFTATPKDIQHRWFVIDADGMVLGRLAAEVAKIIRGKHKPIFTPHMDTGDHVIVINASKVRVTGRKAEQKQYFRHTGYMGHERFTPYATMIEKHPERVIEKAVFGMLPKSSLGRQKLRLKLKVYAGGEHPHTAQQPTVLNLKKSEKE
jgi:large subunit ribosomal protein L13